MIFSLCKHRPNFTYPLLFTCESFIVKEKEFGNLKMILIKNKNGQSKNFLFLGGDKKFNLG